MAVRIILLSLLIVTVFIVNKNASSWNKEKKPKPTQPENNITVNTIKNQAQQIVDNVVKTTQDKVSNVLSETTTKVSNVVIENAVGSLMKQIDKLPPSQKEEIKNTICK